MTRRKRKYTKKQVKFWAAVLATAVLAVIQQNGKPSDPTAALPKADALQNVSVASVYDGDTFKINLNCSWAVYCEKVPVRVAGVDCPEIKGKTQKEKALAQKAKAFTKTFLRHTPVSLSHCSRDKYFRLLCDVHNGQGKNLAEELLLQNLAYPYDGGKKSAVFQ